MKFKPETRSLAIKRWRGILAYVFYNYAFYLFGAALNPLFLLYLALFTLSAYALILGLSDFRPEEFAGFPWTRTPTKAVASYMGLWAVLLTALWLAQSLDFAFTGATPPIVTATAHPTNITAALDLSIMVPGVLVGATLLWRHSPWGLGIAVLMNVKGFLYALALALSSLIASRRGIPDVDSQIPLWLVLSGASLICCVLLLRPFGSARLHA